MTKLTRSDSVKTAEQPTPNTPATTPTHVKPLVTEDAVVQTT